MSTDEAAERLKRPWRISPFEEINGGAGRMIMGADDFAVAYVSGRSQAENAEIAAYIIEAVNNHERLITALSNAQAVLREAGEVVETAKAFLNGARDAFTNLTTNQRQLDMDGCEVGVSRQAVDETVDAILHAADTLIAASLAEKIKTVTEP